MPLDVARVIVEAWSVVPILSKMLLAVFLNMMPFVKGTSKEAAEDPLAVFGAGAA